MGFGLSEAMAGGCAGAATVSEAEFDETLLPGFATVTVQARGVVPTFTVAEICVAVVEERTGLTTVPPGYVMLTVAPETKPVPLMVRV